MRGSAVLLLSTGVVAATNLLYNLLLARMLGVSGFGHASALYTLLMMIAAITLSFQIITSKFIARALDATAQAQIYASLLRRAWQVGLGITILLIAASAYLQSYFNLPAQHDLILLAIAAGVYIPLGVRRGSMQGCYNFRSLAINVVVEVAVKLAAALLFLHLGLGVTGVMAAVLLSIVAAYIVGQPEAKYRSSSAAQIADTHSDEDCAVRRGHASRAVLHRPGNSQQPRHPVGQAFLPAVGSRSLRGCGPCGTRGLHVVVVSREQHVSGVSQLYAPPGRPLGTLHWPVSCGNCHFHIRRSGSAGARGRMENATGEAIPAEHVVLRTPDRICGHDGHLLHRSSSNDV